MKVDIAKSSSITITQTAAIRYVKLNHTAAEIDDLFTIAKINGNAPYGGATGSHRAIRERFSIAYGGWGDPTYLWSGVSFIQATDNEFIARLQQDQQLDPMHWYLASSYTATFGSGSGQFDFTLASVYDYNFLARIHTLTDEAMVENVLFSNLPGRMTFEDYIGKDAVSRGILSYDGLWSRIYEQSARFQSALSKYYTIPLLLGEEHVRYMLRGIVAKAVAIDLIRSYAPMEAVVGGQRYQEWQAEIDAFLQSPPALAGCEATGSGGGAIRLERG